MDAFERIELLLKEKGMSRRELARIAEIPPTTLQSALARKKNMSMDMLAEIAKALGTSVAYLTGEIDEPKSPYAINGKSYHDMTDEERENAEAFVNEVGKITEDIHIEVVEGLPLALLKKLTPEQKKAMCQLLESFTSEDTPDE